MSRLCVSLPLSHSILIFLRPFTNPQINGDVGKWRKRGVHRLTRPLSFSSPRSLREFSLSGPSDTPPVGMSRGSMTWSLRSSSSSSRSMWVRSTRRVACVPLSHAIRSFVSPNVPLGAVPCQERHRQPSAVPRAVWAAEAAWSSSPEKISDPTYDPASPEQPSGCFCPPGTDGQLDGGIGLFLGFSNCVSDPVPTWTLEIKYQHPNSEADPPTLVPVLSLLVT